METGKLTRLFILLTVATALAGCASPPVQYEVRDSAGDLVVSRSIELDQPESATQALHDAFLQADYARCQGLALLIQDAWPLDRQLASTARRTAAWCLLFTYDDDRPSESALEAEARNLAILDASLGEFQALPPRWSAEVEAVERAVNERSRCREAFGQAVNALRQASRSNLAEPSARAAERIQQRYPGCDATASLTKMAQVPWNTEGVEE